MGEMRRIMRPADIRRSVTEWVAQGYHVEVKPDGTLLITPPAPDAPKDAFDMVDMRR